MRFFLLFTPLLLMALLVQSGFWVPSYSRQSQANPQRLQQFIHASIGDAKILNPILNADSASSDIVEKVFDGLLDLDDNLQLRGRLATSWETHEVLYLRINHNASIADGSQPNARQLREKIQTWLKTQADLQERLQAIQILPAQQQSFEVFLPDKTRIAVNLNIPETLHFQLSQVTADFFKRLTVLLGDNYEENRPWLQWLPKPEQHKPVILNAVKKDFPIFEHNPVLRFYLRKNVLFHDGEVFDAEDVLFTYQALMNPKNLSPRTSDFEPIKSLKVHDAHTVDVIYKRLFSPAINAWMIGILPEHRLNQQALLQEQQQRGISGKAAENFGLRDSDFNRHPIGTGAFKFVSWRSDEQIHLQRNAHYWEGAPLYQDYFYRIIPDTVTRELEFRSGAIDAYNPQPYQVKRYQQDPDYQYFSSLQTAYTYIGYNQRRPLFQDARLRKALGLALNVEEIMAYVLYGQGERISGPYPKNTRWYNPEVKPLAYDPAMALSLLAELGWQRNREGWLEKDGKILEFTLITNHGNALRKAILSIAQDHWRRIGIRCHTQVFEWAVFLQDFVNPGQFDAVVLGWGMGIDPDLYQIWHSSQSGKHQLNFIAYQNAKADQLIEQIRETYDLNKQQQLTRQLHQQIAADHAYTFLYAPLKTQVLDKKIVMQTADGNYVKIPEPHSGDLMFHFKRWKKLEIMPRF